MTNTLRLALLAVSVMGGASLACDKTPEPKPDPAPATPTATASSTTTTSNGDTSSGAPNANPANTSASSSSGPTSDPNKGSFTLAEATKDLKGTGPLVAKIDTGKGVIQCKLFDDKAPNTVANFIGLATGKRAWRDSSSGTWVNKVAYDGTVFHRIIKGFMIQGGDQKGNGSGEPGYVIPDEIWAGAKHDHAGQLCMANRGHNTNGAQFFITDGAAAWLDGNYTIFGECAPVEVVHDIANGPTQGDQAKPPVKINSVTISRDDSAKK